MIRTFIIPDFKKSGLQFQSKQYGDRRSLGISKNGKTILFPVQSGSQVKLNMNIGDRFVFQKYFDGKEDGFQDYTVTDHDKRTIIILNWKF